MRLTEKEKRYLKTKVYNGWDNRDIENTKFFSRPRYARIIGHMRMKLRESVGV